MDAKQFDAALSDAETRLRRLKTLYEQWFMGIEKVEPSLRRKELEDLLARLRKEPVNNTAQRFRLQQLVQRHIAFSTHWRRIGRQIEEGTYQRDVMRAQRRAQKPVGRQTEVEAEVSYEVDLDLDIEVEVDGAYAEFEATAEGHAAEPAAAAQPMAAAAKPGAMAARAAAPAAATAPSAKAAVVRSPSDSGPRPLGETAGAPTRRSISPFALPAAANAAARNSRVPPARDAGQAAAAEQPRAATNGAAAAPAPAPAGQARAAVNGAGEARPRVAAAHGAGEARPRVAAAAGSAGAKPVAVRSPSPAQAGAPQAARSASQNNAAAASPATGAAAASRAVAAAEPARNGRVAAPSSSEAAEAKPRPAPTAAASGGSSFTNADLDRIYDQYVAARARNAERIDNVRRETLEKSIRAMLPQLEQKHAGKKIDFDVVVKDGKVALKPAPK